jgi:hypothetical protein
VLHRFGSMPPAFPIRWQIDWRLDSAKQRLAVALVISLVLHALIYGAWQVAPATTAFFKDLIAPVLPPKPKTALAPKTPEEMSAPKREVPLVFVEIDPALASQEPPKETKNYSTDHSLAANPEPKDLEVPKIEGKKTPVVRTLDSPKPDPKPKPEPKPEPKSEPKPLEPDPTPAAAQTPAPKPATTPPPGQLASAKPLTQSPAPKAIELSPISESKPVLTPAPPAVPQRPRTVREARARAPSLAGERSQQEGGVQRRAHIAMVDARRSPFGSYDSVFISMVQARWYQLLDNNQYMLDRRGKVVVSFRLHQDGRISQMEMMENTVGDMLSLLCQKAVLDPAPFPKWPNDMRQIVGGSYREVKFTFYYD